tara:strand:+ start:305 stop:535 length:231 start_codon:yes stop_codon:yes gene_type:complete
MEDVAMNEHAEKATELIGQIAEQNDFRLAHVATQRAQVEATLAVAEELAIISNAINRHGGLTSEKLAQITDAIAGI